MTTVDFITELFCRVDEQLQKSNKGKNTVRPNSIPVKSLHCRCYLRSRVSVNKLSGAG